MERARTDMSLVPTPSDLLVCRNDGPGSTCLLPKCVSDPKTTSQSRLTAAEKKKGGMSGTRRESCASARTIELGGVASDLWGFGFEADDELAVPVGVVGHCVLVGVVVVGLKEEGRLVRVIAMCHAVTGCYDLTHTGPCVMPSTSVIHVACFAVGAVVGGGVATAISSRKPVLRPPPVIDLDQNGDAKISTALVPAPAASAVLKYGHPGGCPRPPRRRVRD